MIAYAAAKAALSHYSKSLANEVGPTGTRGQHHRAGLR
jgi:NAD(P)-dependent dehydrogenase (short-subunit alcohol dehydrogenase family)